MPAFMRPGESFDAMQPDTAPTPAYAASQAERPVASKTFWPCHICCCLPPALRGMVPSFCLEIHDCTHLQLIMGLTSAVTLFFKELCGILELKELVVPLMWWRPALVLIATLPNIAYMIRILQGFDGQLREKLEDVAMKKKELTEAYESLVGAMEDIVGKAAESSATMAERGFDSKRRDFQRFLERTLQTYSRRVVTTEAEEQDLLKHFRGFVKRWLTVFQECSVDPIACPKIVVSDAELDQCRSIPELGQLVVERLKLTELKFISARRDEDRLAIQGLKAEHPSMFDSGMGWVNSAVAAVSSSFTGNEVSAPVEIEMSSTAVMRAEPQLSRRDSALVAGTVKGIRRPSFAASDAGSDAGSFHSDLKSSSRSDSANDGRNAPRCSCFPQCSWCVCGPPGRFGCSCRPQQGRALVAQCLCAQVAMLSLSHLNLFQGACAISILILLELSVGDRDVLLLSLATLYLICLVIFCVLFEQIDHMQQLEREVAQLKEEGDKLASRREEMEAFWASMQSLTDVWVHRTVPRLELLKEIQCCLESAPQEDRVHYMANANSVLEELEKRLPRLDCWRAGGELSESSKKAFSAELHSCCEHQTEFPVLITNLKHIIQAKVLAIGDADARQPNSFSV